MFIRDDREEGDNDSDWFHILFLYVLNVLLTDFYGSIVFCYMAPIVHYLHYK